MPPVNLASMRSIDGKTLVHLAQGEPDMVDFLTATDPTLCSITNNMNKTLLWELLEGEKALEKAHTKVVNVLLQAGMSKLGVVRC